MIIYLLYISSNILLVLSASFQSDFVIIDYYIKHSSLVIKTILSNNNNEQETLLLPINQQLQQSVIPVAIAGKLLNSDICCNVTLPDMKTNILQYTTSNNEIKINKPHLQKYEFIISNDVNYKQLISFGLAFPFHSSFHSFLYQMKINNYINKLTYSVIPHNTNPKNENSSHGHLCLGSFDNINKQSKTKYDLHKYSCKVNSTLLEWNCNVKDISFTYNASNTISLLSITSIVYFNIHKEGINIPYDAFALIRETELFSYLFYKGYCRTVLNAYLYDVICFKKHIFYPLISNSSLHFHFNTFDISFPLEDLFSCDNTGQICNSLLYTNIHSDSNKWVFGSLLFSKLNATEFNEEEEIVSFYISDDNANSIITHIPITTKRLLLCLLKIMLYIIILNIIILLYIIKCNINIVLCKNE